MLVYSNIVKGSCCDDSKQVTWFSAELTAPYFVSLWLWGSLPVGQSRDCLYDECVLPVILCYIAGSYNNLIFIISAFSFIKQWHILDTWMKSEDSAGIVSVFQDLHTNTVTF
jgi:hypothetical protein